MPIKVEDLITQIAKELRGKKVTRTVFVKLLYLCEYEYFKRNRRRLTPLKWIAFHFGPWAYELTNLGGGVSLLETEEKLLDSGRIAYLLGGGDSYKLETTTYIKDVEVLGIVRSVVNEWADVHLYKLLDHAYNETEPMLNVERKGETLDFETIAKPLKLPPYKPPREKVTLFRKKMEEASRKRKELWEKTAEYQVPIDPQLIEVLEKLDDLDSENQIKCCKSE